MNNKQILNIGKYVFASSFLLGNICLFGYWSTKLALFAMSGFLLLIVGSVFNLLVISGLLIYGFVNTSKLNTCLQATSILLANIPIAILYALIGLHII
ncbi:hypothetical protein [Chryseobacterium paridis]|uniref:LIVCS family branched-chain amino acid:cation transporter n=1 Tax=Chryseobacterium paridis TaxID=2800328 RepID=A0ABS1FNZ5_9FLAO|nr:hypothetical protein [Chryseobacterium paridis]MBK1894159.1 hypothetical protein [Chryseobacterium paridis]